MPNLPLHIYLAKCVADRLDWGWLNDHAPSLYLGSTAPDVRAMTKWPRERTHFAPLSSEEVGAGPAAMFKLHPTLAGSNGLSPATRAFLVGYVSHLVADESWISPRLPPQLRPSAGQPRRGRHRAPRPHLGPDPPVGHGPHRLTRPKPLSSATGRPGTRPPSASRSSSWTATRYPPGQNGLGVSCHGNLAGTA